MQESWAIPLAQTRTTAMKAFMGGTVLVSVAPYAPEHRRVSGDAAPPARKIVTVGPP
ncbi:hypothetical protein ME121_2421 [Methylobacterium sp. ME121]|nr:hypothetical protein ME121_2421 [Methylobacterium sp. ME121]